MISRWRSSVIASFAILAAAPLGAQDAAGDRVVPIPVGGLAGQSVAVLPLTLVIAEASLKHDTLYAAYADQAAALARADSIIGTALTSRGPEVQWVLPPALRRVARRSPGMVKDPDHLGQAVLRSSRIKEVPEPLRAELRNLVAAAGGRRALVPAALSFTRDTAASAPVRADLALVLVDARAGAVLWRTVIRGAGATPSLALDAALAAALPVDLQSP